MICSQITVEQTGNNYDCVNGTCTKTVGGQYTEPTCAGACKKKDNTEMLVLAGVALLGAYLLFGGKK